MQLERDRTRTPASASLAPKPVLLTLPQAANGFSWDLKKKIMSDSSAIFKTKNFINWGVGHNPREPKLPKLHEVTCLSFKT